MDEEPKPVTLTYGAPFTLNVGDTVVWDIPGGDPLLEYHDYGRTFGIDDAEPAAERKVKLAMIAEIIWEGMDFDMSAEDVAKAVLAAIEGYDEGD
jgi:hypothetical protein